MYCLLRKGEKMKGIVLISHGLMAQGMAQSATMFYGEDIEQLAFCGLKQEDNPDDFGHKIQDTIRQVDDGDGVIILADILYGTPCNQAAKLLDEKIELITGMNFPMLLQLLADRENKAVLIDTGKSAVQDVKKVLFSSADNSDEWDF